MAHFLQYPDQVLSTYSWRLRRKNKTQPQSSKCDCGTNIKFDLQIKYNHYSTPFLSLNINILTFNISFSWRPPSWNYARCRYISKQNSMEFHFPRRKQITTILLILNTVFISCSIWSIKYTLSIVIFTRCFISCWQFSAGREA